MNTITITRTRITLGVLVLLLTGVVATAQAQQPGPGRCGQQGRGKEMRFERMVDRLDLTVEQVQAIKKIREEVRTENQELRKQVMRLENEKRGELLQDEPATKAVLDLTRKIGDIRTELQANRMQCRLEVRNLLTPEQRDKMLVQGERHGRRGGGRRGGNCGDRCDDGEPRRGGAGHGKNGNGSGNNGRGNW